MRDINKKKHQTAFHDYNETLTFPSPRFCLKRLNNFDHVVGTISYWISSIKKNSHQSSEFHQTAFIWKVKENTIAILNKDTIAVDINDLGQILCYFNQKLTIYDNGEYQEVECSKRTMFPLQAKAFNNKGVIVGSSQHPTKRRGIFLDQAIVIENGEFNYLSDLVINVGDWFIYEANDINDHGDIIGTAIDSNNQHRAVLFRKIP